MPGLFELKALAVLAVGALAGLLLAVPIEVMGFAFVIAWAAFLGWLMLRGGSRR